MKQLFNTKKETGSDGKNVHLSQKSAPLSAFDIIRFDLLKDQNIIYPHIKKTAEGKKGADAGLERPRGPAVVGTGGGKAAGVQKDIHGDSFFPAQGLDARPGGVEVEFIDPTVWFHSGHLLSVIQKTEHDPAEAGGA